MRVYFQFKHDAPPCQDFDLVDEIVIIIVKVDLQDLTGIGAQDALEYLLEGQDRAAFAGFPDFFLIVVIPAPIAIAVGGGRRDSAGKQAGEQDKAEKQGLHGGTLLLGDPAPCRKGPDWKLTDAGNRLSGVLGQNAGRAARGGPCKQRTEPMVSLTHLIGAAAAGAVATAGFAGGSTPADTQADGVPARYEIDAGTGYPEIRDQLSQQGFEVSKYEQYARKIEVKGLDASGRCMEVYFHPASGEELRRERDDDCGHAGDDDDDDDRYDD
jgi:hypothetical protein